MTFYDINTPSLFLNDGTVDINLQNNLSPTGTIWTMRTTVDDKLRFHTNTNPKVFELDGSSGQVSASSLSLTNASGTVSLKPDPATSTYDFNFPAAPPSANQVITYNGSSNVFQNLIDNPQFVLTVRKDPQFGQFGSVLSALASIPTVGPDVPSTTKRYVIEVKRGDYLEGGNLLLPSFVYIVGESLEATRIFPSAAGYDLFTLSSNSGVSTLSILNVATPNKAVVFNDVGNYSLVFRLQVENCNRAIFCQSTSQDSTCYLTHIRIFGATEYGIKLVDDGIHLCNVNGENITIKNGGTEALSIDGSVSSFSGRAVALEGNGTGTGVSLLRGKVVIRGAYIKNWATAVNVVSNVDPHTLLLSGIIFEGCTQNINVAASNTTGHYDGYTEYEKTIIHISSTFFIANQNRNIITVSKKGSDFASVKSAIDSITDASDTNRYVVYVGPGIYNEDPFTIKSYVVLKGFFKNSTILVANNPAVPFVTMQYYSIIDELRLTTGIAFPTVPPAGGILLDFHGEPFGRNMRCQNVIFDSCETLVRVTSDNGFAMALFLDCLIEAIGNFVNGFIIKDDPTTHNPIIFFADGIFFYPFSQFYVDKVLDISSTSPVQNVRCFISDFLIARPVPFLTGTCVKIEGAVRVACDASFYGGLGEGMLIPNSAVAPDVFFTSTVFYNTHDITISNSSVTGVLQGGATRTKIDIVSDNMSVMLNGIEGDILMTGNIYQGANIVQSTNISTQIQQGAATGAIDPPDITTPSGLDITVPAGSGYLMISSSPDYLKYVTWTTQTITLPANTLSWIYVNNIGTLLSSTAHPDHFFNIDIGAVKTGATTVTYIQQVPINMTHVGTKTDHVIRDAIGSIFESGCLATPSATAMQINVSSGSYWYGTNNYTPSSVADISMIGYYRDGASGFVETAAFSAVPVMYDDGSGTLAAIPLLNWTKHVLYIVGDGVDQKYLFLYGQELFSTEALAQTGNVPTRPSFFVGNVSPITAIIVTNGDVTLPASRLRDVRPIPGFRAEGATASADHNSLLNLTTGNSHPQYFRVDGTSMMSGNIDVGTNNIMNVGTVDGVDVSAHAARHLPGGADPLTTSVPVTVGSTNTEGSASSFARSDHVHAHGNQTGTTLHALATGASHGFMSSTDKSKLDASTNLSTASTLVQRDGSGSSSFAQVSFDNAAKTQAVNVVAPSALVASYTLTLPHNTGTNAYVLSTDGTGVTSWVPSAAGFTDPMTTAGDIIYRDATNTTTRLPIGTVGQTLQVTSSTQIAWQTQQQSQKTVIILFDDFRGGASPYGDLNWTSSVGGTGGSIVLPSPTPSGDWLGAVQLECQQDSPVSFSTVKRGGSCVRLSKGTLTSEFTLYLQNSIPTSPHDYSVRIGFSNGTITSGDPTDGIYFFLSLSSLMWQFRAASGGTISTGTSSVALASTTWYTLGIDVNASGTLVTYYIDGISVGTLNTNIPGATQPLTPFIQIQKITGNGIRKVVIDYFSYTYTLTATRY